MIESRVAIVSGASAGLGSLTALSLAETGYRVFAGVRDSGGCPVTPSWASVERATAVKTHAPVDAVLNGA